MWRQGLSPLIFMYLLLDGWLQQSFFTATTIAVIDDGVDTRLVHDWDISLIDRRELSDPKTRTDVTNKEESDCETTVADTVWSIFRRTRASFEPRSHCHCRNARLWSIWRFTSTDTVKNGAVSGMCGEMKSSRVREYCSTSSGFIVDETFWIWSVIDSERMVVSLPTRGKIVRGCESSGDNVGTKVSSVR